MNIQEIQKDFDAAVTAIYWQHRCEELEVVAAALYLGHDGAKEQFDMYKAVYLRGAKTMNGRDCGVDRK